MMYWYVLQTKPKKEETVQLQLQKAKYEAFFPRMKTLFTTKPLFPSYLFIRTDFDIPNHYQLVRYTRGVSRILGDFGGPRPIADTIVETLMSHTRDGSLLEQELLFNVGDSVKVKRGILRDLIGMVEKNMSDAGRVKILFKWVRKSMHAVLKYTDLERAA